MIQAHAHPDGDYVVINGKVLDISRSLGIVNHSPTGISWGYGGSGPAQLALAILLEFSRKETALKYYQRFKFEIIANMPRGKNWTMANDAVHGWLDAQRKKDGGAL